MIDYWTLPEGMVIGDRYRLLEEIGAGGMGAVFEGMDLLLERPVAIKFLDPSLVANAENVTRFQREALAAGRVGHPNICDVRDRGVTETGLHYIVMELLKGISFYELIQREGPLSPTRAVPIVLEVLSALGAAHRAGIIHRDLKPDNIFISLDGGGKGQVKLLDFGVSRFLGDSTTLRITKTGKVLGTPLYVSPEQALAAGDLDQRADLWSVGVMLYEAITGQPPFKGRNTGQILVKIIKDDVTPPSELTPEITPQLEAVILKALAKDRDERYGSAETFGIDLRRALRSHS